MIESDGSITAYCATDGNQGQPFGLAGALSNRRHRLVQFEIFHRRIAMISHDDDPCSEINNVIGLAALLATLLDDRIHGITQGIHFQRRSKSSLQYCALFTDLLIGKL